MDISQIDKNFKIETKISKADIRFFKNQLRVFPYYFD